MSRCIAAFDLGSTMGYAVQGPARIVAGSITFATATQLRDAKAIRADRRCDIRAQKMHAWVGEFLHVWKPEVVVFEDVQFAKSQAQAHLWATFRGILWSQCLCYGIQRIDCLATGKLKIFATGNGHADKDAMARGLLKREPDQFDAVEGGLLQRNSMQRLDDNAIDAYLLLRWAQRIYEKP